MKYAVKLLGLFLISINAYSFPQMVLKGYPNCTACHISPNGGGVLTEYGRGISKDLLSQWGSEREAKQLYGLAELPEWLKTGGDVRWVQYYQNSQTAEQARFIFMQADAEAAATLKDFDIVGTAGYKDKYSDTEKHFISRRHYLTYRPYENYSVRVGRFLPSFGYLLPDHYIVTRRDLGWDQGTESYNFEASYQGEKFRAYTTFIFATPGDSYATGEKGVSNEGRFTILESSEIGWGAYYGWKETRKRFLVGPRALIAITPWLALLTEWDLQLLSPKTTANTTGIFEYLRLEATALQCLKFFVSQEWERTDWKNPHQTKQAYTVGAMWFPRPHLELGASFRKQKNRTTASGFDDMAWLMFHFYL